MQIRGRHWLVLWLFAFLAVAAIVLSRGTRSYQLARELDNARSDREALEAVAAELQRGINESPGRAAIGGFTVFITRRRSLPSRSSWY